ncbi:hypothetical protein VNO80_17752 [Phaseolus coccineus]|uniref:Uncharacterized protein n=1 Tax=Phaseolus coccineus TaxID=3886 RepID=A0AAN9MDA4_PHACN
MTAKILLLLDLDLDLDLCSLVIKLQHLLYPLWSRILVSECGDWKETKMLQYGGKIFGKECGRDSLNKWFEVDRKTRKVQTIYFGWIGGGNSSKYATQVTMVKPNRSEEDPRGGYTVRSAYIVLFIQKLCQIRHENGVIRRSE